jgi:hypothetical protein
MCDPLSSSSLPFLALTSLFLILLLLLLLMLFLLLLLSSVPRLSYAILQPTDKVEEPYVLFRPI